MDEKKKSISEETKEGKILNEEVIELVEFEEFRNAFKKTDAKKETEKETSVKKESKDTKLFDDEKETQKEEISKEKRDTGKEKEKAKSPEENQEVVKTETSDKDMDAEKKDSSDKDKKTEKKDSSDEDKKAKKKDSSDKDKKTEKKDSSDEDKKTEKKDSSDKDKKNEEKDSSDEDKKAEKTEDSNKNEKVDGDTSSKKEPTGSVKEDKKNKKGVAIVLGSFVALITIVYIAGLVYFSNYFYPSVAINGLNVSNMNKVTAKAALDEFNKNYTLTLETIDAKKVIISGSEIEMNIQLHDEFDDCMKAQKAYLWFVNFMKHHDFAIGANATWNEEKLNSLYKNMQILDKKLMLEPKDAYIGIADGKFTIVKEVLGTTINTEQFKATINDSLSNVVVAVKLQDAGCYNLPKVYSTDETLNADFQAKNEFMDGVITLQLDDLTLEPGMELYDAVLEKKGDTYTISKTQVQNYVKELAAQYDTIGTERTFTSTYGGNRKVKISGTAFGYEMDQEATADALYSALQSKKAATVEVVFKSKGYTLQGENDIGDTYIECNLSEQKVVAYKDGKKIAEGDCVSGCEAIGNGTCIGLYKIQDKLSPTVLRGPQKAVTKTVTKKNKKGKKVKVKETKMEYEYESPVTFWMQFNGGYGLHDAAGWRSVYGGSIYYYSGSHGCVNLPYDLAKALYENFDIGDPVVVYFYDNENRK